MDADIARDHGLIIKIEDLLDRRRPWADVPGRILAAAIRQAVAEEGQPDRADSEADVVQALGWLRDLADQMAGEHLSAAAATISTAIDRLLLLLPVSVARDFAASDDTAAAATEPAWEREPVFGGALATIPLDDPLAVPPPPAPPARWASKREAREPDAEQREVDGQLQLAQAASARDPRPWVYCLDRLPEEPGRYEVAVWEPGELLGDPLRTGEDVRWWKARESWDGWDPGISGSVYAWQRTAEPPALRQRDLEPIEKIPVRWLPADYLEGLPE
jgi:hypothetical protein